MKVELIGDEFKLQEEVTVRGYTIPAGFRTDFASIPRFALSLMGSPVRKEYRRASLVHDFLCVTKMATRASADRIFYEILLEDGTKKRQALLMYLAVIVWGVVARVR
jgi:hypothetical protein